MFLTEFLISFTKSFTSHNSILGLSEVLITFPPAFSFLQVCICVFQAQEAVAIQMVVFDALFSKF